MTLTPGTRLGPYEVLDTLGEGGMGEVFRATDTNLKRQVLRFHVRQPSRRTANGSAFSLCPIDT